MTESNSLHRFAEILEAYGANASHWPADQRETLLELIARSDEAREMLEQARQLDQLLDQYTVAESDDKLLHQVLDGIPKTTLVDQFLAWLWPKQKSLFWQPALAMSLPLVLGIMVGSLWTPVDPVDDWDEEGIYVMGLYSIEDQEP